MKIPFLATASLAAISAFALTPSAFAQASLAGDWQGTLDANGTAFHLVWHLTAAADGTEMAGTFTQVEPQAQPAANVLFKHSAAKAAAPAAVQPATPAAAQAAATAAPGIAGDWAGTLTAGSAELHLVLHVIAAKDGSLTATLDSVDQGANGIPVDAVTLKDSKLNLTVNAVPGHGAYEGTLNKDATAIDGTWTQGGQSLPLNFKRAKP